ncbi:MAG: zinc ribbon domain-containing protein [Actinomycetota bacterium]
MAERCWRCGAEIRPDDAFCGSCGADLHVPAPDLDLTLDGTTTATTGPVVASSAGSPRWVLAVGLVLVTGVVAFFALTNRDDESADDDPAPAIGDTTQDDGPEDGGADELDIGTIEPDPATTIPPIDLAGPIEWDITREAPGIPIAVIEIGDSTFVYDVVQHGIPTSEQRTGEITVAEREFSGGPWVERGPMLPAGSWVGAIVPSADGAIAAGTDADGRPTVWRTSDGTTWLAEELPGVSLGDVTLRPVALIEHEGVVLVVGREPFPVPLALERAARRVADDPSVSVSWSAATNTVLLNGAFGLVVDEFSLTELGIDEDSSPSATDPGPIWVFEDGAWSSHIIEGEVTGLAAVPDWPAIYVTYVAETGFDLASWVDGGWRVERTDIGPDAVATGPGGFITVGTDARAFTITPLGDGWTGDPIEAPDLGGIGRTFTTDATGVLFGMIEEADDIIEVDRGDGLVILRDGYQLTSLEGAVLELSRDGDVVGLFGQMRESMPHRVDRVDDGYVLSFLDRTDETDLVTFTLAELQELFFASLPPYAYDDGRLTTLYSTDFDRWYGGIVPGTGVPTNGSVWSTTTADRVWLAVTVRGDIRGDWDEQLIGTYTLLEAPIPGR